MKSACQWSVTQKDVSTAFESFLPPAYILLHPLQWQQLWTWKKEQAGPQTSEHYSQNRGSNPGIRSFD